MRTTRTALGIKSHTGWGAVVAVVGPSEALQIVAKRRIDMATTFEEGALYHKGEALTPAKASTMISTAEKKLERIAAKQIADLIAELAAEGHDAVIAGVVSGSPKPLPPLENILKSHALIHAAEGELYRRILSNASQSSGLRVVRVPSKDLEPRARAVLGASQSVLADRLAQIGKSSGRPWAADQKQSALAAIVALLEAPR